MGKKSKPVSPLQRNLFGEIAPAMPTAASQGERPTIPEGTPRVSLTPPKANNFSKTRTVARTETQARTPNLFAGDTMSAEDFIKALEFDIWRRNEALLSRGKVR